MRENWNSSQARFKALQGQARNHRDENKALNAEVAELKSKMEAGTASDVS